MRGFGVLEKAMRNSSSLVREGQGQRMASICKDIGYSAEADFAQRESGLWHLRGAEGDRLTERSEGRKLPQLEPRALAVLRNLKTFFWGASGGMQGGRSGDVVTRPEIMSRSRLCRAVSE